ncbi:MAG: hypothetical protein PUP46_06820 [Endozoicomonas sp. (ex Botrylloides leachii)]|nr:hypothetical protein [Endozoicomonas sp. (ex Botrylloides leachii)]
MTVAIKPEGKTVSVGVQELVEKLRNQGVQSGRAEAEKITSEAKSQAALLIKEAEKKAEIIIGKAKEEASFITKAGTEALQLAERNAILELKSFLLDTFSDQLRAAVGHSMSNQDLLEKMIIEVAGKNSLHNEKNVTAVLPQTIVGVNELQENPELLKKDSILEFSMGQVGAMLQKGVTFAVGDKNQTGITFRLKDKDIEVELSEEAVASVLLHHLQPRFRALLEGIIK